MGYGPKKSTKPKKKKKKKTPTPMRGKRYGY